MGDKPHVRIGDYWFRLAEGLDDPTLGFSYRRFPLQESWESLFADRQVISGSPGVQNVKTDDLRWVMTSFDGGEGQRVYDIADDAGASRFESATGLDFSVPGQFSLAHRIAQAGSTGAASTTVEGNTWADSVGTSTVVNTTDRRLNSVGDRVSVDISLATGTWLVDFYGYEDSPTRIEGDTFNKVTGNASDSGTNKKLNTDGTIVEKPNRNPIDGPVHLKARVQVHRSPVIEGPAASIGLAVRNHDNGNVVASKTQDVYAIEGWVFVELTFTAGAGKTYDYRVQVKDMNGNDSVELDYIDEDEQDDREYSWEVRKGGSTVASGSASTNDNTSTQKLASATVQEAAGPSTYTLRVTRSSGASRKIEVDKAVYTQVSMHDPRLMELGLSNQTWLIDYDSGGSPNAFYWDGANAKWQAITTFGPAAGKAIAMAHSDSYEFVALDDKKVYRIKKPSTAQQYTAASTDPIVGIAVGGGRLFVLTSDPTNGLALFDTDLEGTPNVALTARSAGMSLPKGQQADTDISQRIAGTAQGCVFFANVGPDCYVWSWNAGSATGQNLINGGLPRGFRATAIQSGLGYVWLGGGLPVVDSSGNTVQRPALFVINPDGTAATVDVKLWRDADDASSKIVAMQLYADDLWVLTQVESPLRFRLWRVSLTSPVAGFCYQEVLTDETQSTGQARSLSINWKEKFAIWSLGSPYREDDSEYRTTDDCILYTSRHTFGLNESKTLLELQLLADIPTGTLVELLYSVDGGAFVSAGSFVSSGPQSITISTPENSVSFGYLQLAARCFSSDAARTPTVYSFGARAYCQVFRRQVEMILDCASETSTFHMNGAQTPGAVAAAYLFALADQGGIVQFEDHYSDPELPATRSVTVRDPTKIMTNPGESFVRVILEERGDS